MRLKKFLITIFSLITFLSININSTNAEDLIKLDYSDEKVLDMIDQLFILGFNGRKLDDNKDLKKVLEKTNVGGFILFDANEGGNIKGINGKVIKNTKGRNIDNPKQLKNLIQELQNNSKTKLFMAVDDEGGVIKRLSSKRGFVEYMKSAKYYGSQIDNKEIVEDAEAHAKYLKSFGINLNFGPVVDVDYKNNPIISKYNRSFGTNTELIYMKADKYIKNHQSEGVLNAIKHYPGHGSSLTDSHKGITDITKTYKKEELDIFKILIKNNDTENKSKVDDINFIMSGHLLNKNIDDKFPASLSEIHLNIIRNLGYDNIIITDDIEMGAIKNNYNKIDAIKLALNSGNDMIIMSDINIKNYLVLREQILKMIKNGEIKLGNILEKYDRIQRIKKLLN